MSGLRPDESLRVIQAEREAAERVLQSKDSSDAAKRAARKHLRLSAEK